MNIPSILYLEERKAPPVAGQKVFEDLFIDKLLDEKTISALSAGCGRAELTARQEIFAALRRPDFYSSVENLRQALTDLSQARDAGLHAANRCEELIIFIRYASRYAAFHRAALKVEGGGALFAAFKKFIASLTAEMTKLSDELSVLESGFEKIKTTDLSFIKSRIYLEAASGEDFSFQIKKFAAEMGLGDISAPRQKEFHIQNVLSEALLKLYPAYFAKLTDFYARYKLSLGEEVLRLRHEIDFYLSVDALVRRAEKSGYVWCLPKVSERRVYRAADCRDVSLLLKEQSAVPNDIDFSDGVSNTADGVKIKESVYFLTGANGGGKTTYLRAMAINLILFLGGCPVFCRAAQIYRFTGVFTHFPADESFTGSGRLLEEQKRADEILAVAGEGSFVFLNETYSGTDDVKGSALTLDTAKKLRDRGAFCLYVTHFHQVCEGDIPSLTTAVDEEDGNRRTFKIMKSSSLSSSYANDILKKYGLTKETLIKKAGGGVII